MFKMILQDKIGESTIYAASLDNQPILTVRKYQKEAEINQDEDDPYVMSISYLAAEKEGIVFLITEGGYSQIKHYEYNHKYNRFKLTRQENKIETVDCLFSKFEYDSLTSPHLQAIDFDSHAQILSKEIVDLPDDCREVFRDKFSNCRDDLSYEQKLEQQVGRRKDPIEFVVALLHKWNVYANKKMDERIVNNYQNLLIQKEQGHERIFSQFPDPRTKEAAYIEAERELKRMKKNLSSGRATEHTRITIQAKLPKVRQLLIEREKDKKKIASEIEKMIQEHEPIQKDFKFREFGYGQKD